MDFWEDVFYGISKLVALGCVKTNVPYIDCVIRRWIVALSNVFIEWNMEY